VKACEDSTRPLFSEVLAAGECWAVIRLPPVHDEIIACGRISARLRIPDWLDEAGRWHRAGSAGDLR